MALQAQHPSNALSPDLRGRGRNDILEELQMLRDRDHQLGNLAGVYSAYLGQQVLNNLTALSDPQSELTCNAASAASRKRSRDRDDPSSMTQGDLNLLNFPSNNGEISTGVSREQSRLFRSTETSTSGRPPAVSSSAVSHFHHQSIEIDALIRFQTERLRSGLEEARKRHCSAVLSLLEAEAVKRMREKEAELESARRINAELEERVRQLSGESQIWFNAAKNNEAIVTSLRAGIEQLLLQSTAAGVPPAMEGYGDSDCALFPADDAQSCCFDDDKREAIVAGVAAEEAAVQRENEELRLRSACRVCQVEDVCVLLLPCRHLCLCKDCEPRLDTCPICHSTKNASLQIFMS